MEEETTSLNLQRLDTEKRISINYIKEQIDKVVSESEYSDFKPCIKINCDKAETKWLSITKSQLMAIKEILSGEKNDIK